jgi:hypothetical protein
MGAIELRRRFDRGFDAVGSCKSKVGAELVEGFSVLVLEIRLVDLIAASANVHERSHNVGNCLVKGEMRVAFSLSRLENIRLLQLAEFIIGIDSQFRSHFVVTGAGHFAEEDRDWIRTGCYVVRTEGGQRIRGIIKFVLIILSRVPRHVRCQQHMGDRLVIELRDRRGDHLHVR